MRDHVQIRGSSSTGCRACAGNTCGVCSLFDAGTLRDFATRSHRAHYARGTEILALGEEADKIGTIVSGLVKLVTISEAGDEHLIQLLKPGQIVGDLTSSHNVFSWEAATETEVCWLSRKGLADLFRSRPELYGAYLTVVSRQLKEHQLWVADMRGRSTLERIALWLLHMAPRTDGRPAREIPIALSRRDLASLLDMTVETLCRVLHQLVERGAIKLLAPDLVELTSLDRLRLLARDEGGQPNAEAAVPTARGPGRARA